MEEKIFGQVYSPVLMINWNDSVWEGLKQEHNLIK